MIKLFFKSFLELFCKLFVCVSLLSSPQLMAENSIMSILPVSDYIEAKVMQLGMPLEAQKITAKMQQAFSSQPQWAKSYIESATPGKPLAYHPNFNVTEAEYHSLLAMMNQQVLIPKDSIKLHAEKLANGDVKLSTKPSTSKINGIIIHADEKSAKTSLALLNELTPVNNQNASSPTGRWSGVQWQYQNTEVPLSIKLAIGTRPDFNDHIIYLNVKDAREGKANSYYEILLFENTK